MQIYLDLDGVMIPAKGWTAPPLLADGFPAFSPKATVALNKILQLEASEILLTSTHKSSYPAKAWKEMFQRRDIQADSLQLLPENTLNLSRRQELLEWFSINLPAHPFIILDDDKGLNDLPPFLKKHLVLTSPYVGLTDDHLLQVSSILQQPVLPL